MADPAGTALTDVAAEYAEKLRLATASDAGRAPFLRFCRANRVGEPARILEVGRAAIGSGASRWGLGDEYWCILEQLCVAALAEGDVEFAEDQCAALATKFPGSTRVQRLVGLILEAKGSWDEALSVYDALLEANPANSLAWKRKARGGGRVATARRERHSPPCPLSMVRSPLKRLARAAVQLLRRVPCRSTSRPSLLTPTR